MLPEEARWLSHQLGTLPTKDLYPMCNIGSSTDQFRRLEQPYIDKHLFEPARLKQLEVIHVDAKPAPGVDLVGNIADPQFLARLAELNVRSIMCCNLLEHVTQRAEICNGILSVLKPGGYLIATVPYQFPYHEGPIDTMYRPSVEDLVAAFPGTVVHKAAIVSASALGFELRMKKHLALLRLIVRVVLPFLRPNRWQADVRQLYEIVAGYKITCVVLRKQSTT